jgi:hypothetical protein
MLRKIDGAFDLATKTAELLQSKMEPDLGKIDELGLHV